ncbi:MAG: hypothetical protein GY737_09880 [Desulfobacteraceae bacterium]|nr:hypothetical protein [Desulfobacteraceae bacterium]
MGLDSTLVEQLVKKVLLELTATEPKTRIGILALREDTDLTALSGILPQGAELVCLDDGCSLEDADRLILPTLSCNAMADLAIGRASGKVMESVLAHLLAGRSVEVVTFEYQGYEKTAAHALYDLYESHEKTLSGFGIRRFEPKTEDTLVSRKRLITEKDVAEALAKGAKQIKAGAKAVVTPLGADFARNHNIDITKE